MTDILLNLIPFFGLIVAGWAIYRILKYLGLGPWYIAHPSPYRTETRFSMFYLTREGAETDMMASYKDGWIVDGPERKRILREEYVAAKERELGIK